MTESEKTKEPVLELAEDTELKDMDPKYVECKRTTKENRGTRKWSNYTI